MLGSAGAYAGGPPVGAVVAAGRLGLGYAAVGLGVGYAPLAPGPLQADAGLAAALALPAVPVLTVAAITTDPVLATYFGADWAVEHMEAYAVAYACAQAGVPFAAVLGITNRVGPGAHAEWLVHRDAVHAAVQAVAARLVAGYPPAP